MLYVQSIEAEDNRVLHLGFCFAPRCLFSGRLQVVSTELLKVLIGLRQHVGDIDKLRLGRLGHRRVIAIGLDQMPELPVGIQHHLSQLLLEGHRVEVQLAVLVHAGNDAPWQAGANHLMVHLYQPLGMRLPLMIEISFDFHDALTLEDMALKLELRLQRNDAVNGAGYLQALVLERLGRLVHLDSAAGHNLQLFLCPCRNAVLEVGAPAQGARVAWPVGQQLNPCPHLLKFIELGLTGVAKLVLVQHDCRPIRAANLISGSCKLRHQFSTPPFAT